MTITTYYPSPNGAYDAMNVKRLSVGDTNGDGNVNASDVPSFNGHLLVADKIGIRTANPQTILHLIVPDDGGIRIQAGESGWGSSRLEFYSDPTTSASQWRPGYIASGDNGSFTGRLDFYTNGSGSTVKEGSVLGMSITNGNVGIGTTNPVENLTIGASGNSDLGLGNIVLDNSHYGYVRTWAKSGDTGGIHLGYGETGTDVGIHFSADDAKLKYSPGLNSFYFTGGNVGIGTTSPGSLLDVNGTAQLRGSSGGTGLYVNSSGKVGIGTTSPAYGLDVQSGGFRIGDHFTASIGCADFLIGYSGRRGSPGRAIVDLGNALAFNYAADWTNTYIYGTVSYPSTEEIKKDIKYLTKKDYEYLLDQVRTYDISRYHYKKESPRDSYHLGLIAEHSPKDVVTDDGKAIKAVDYISLVFGGLKALALQVDEMADAGMSDKRVKENLMPIDGVLDSLKRLKGIKFNWKDKSSGARQEIGIIAQEVEKEFPQLVYTDPRSGYKFVKYEKFTPVLIEAIKEQQKEIEELRQEIRTLRKKLTPRAE